MLRLLLIASLPSPGLAATTICRFETECVEAEACAATDYAARIVRPGERTSGAGTFSDDAGTVVLTKLPGPDAATHFSAGNGEGAYEGAFGMMFLTTGEDGTARLTVHFEEGPMAITYLGTCGVAF